MATFIGILELNRGSSSLRPSRSIEICVTSVNMLSTLLDNSTTVLIFVATILLVWYVITLPSMRGLPPGPFPLSLFGNFLMLRMPGADFIGILKDLKEKYGKIFTLKIGSKPFIYINDLKLLQEAFVKRGDVLSSRPHNFYVLKKIEEKAGVGVSLSNGQPWKELRRVSLTAMRDLGVGKKSLEEKVLEEVHVVLDIIGQQRGKPVAMKPWLVKATSNVISSVMFGSRFDFNDPRFNLLLKRLGEATSVNFLFMPANFFPLLRYFTKSEAKIIKTLATTSAYIKELVADHEETFDPDNIRDFVDLVLKMRNSPTGRHFNDLNMRRAIVDIFSAGSETTATTLQWLLYFMATNPAVQHRCQAEIDEILGDGRSVTHADKEKLRFTEATILETLRYRPVAPFGIPHGVDRSFELAGYTIPRDAVVFSNITAIHNDPNIFPNPEIFDPSRWLDKNGDITGRDRLLSFSLGPRSCLGEILAKMELFMFFTSILQFYTVQAQSVDLTPVLGFVSKGKDQAVVFKKR
ncbi:hypothetical protein RRG08_029223 [Elysia crispata]|uniref:Cytochrome P450 n=1 Tax=Elysia crispata TaxID=231223 RepID=A0AAE1DZJ6_9GAST|nr:hypothetical protein RRG08_029223 [Elysia crispata]